MSLASCLKLINKGKQVFTDEEVSEIKASAERARLEGGMTQADAEKHAVQTMLDENIAEHALVNEMVSSAAGKPIPLYAAEQPVAEPEQAKVESTAAVEVTTAPEPVAEPEQAEQLPLFKQGSAVDTARTDAAAFKQMAAVQKIVTGIKAAWKNAPKIVVVRDMQDTNVPKVVSDLDTKMKSNGATGEPRGFIYQGTVYIVAGQNKTQADVLETISHEVLGHAGLRGMFGTSLNKVLNEIAVMRQSDIIAKAREYAFHNGNVNAKSTNDEVWAAMSQDNKLHAAEEVLAEMAESQPDATMVKRAVAAIRQWLREAGFNLKLTDNDIINRFIIPARSFIENGAMAPGLSDSLQAAYHRASQTDSAEFRADVLNESWLNEQIDYAKSKPRNRYGVPYMGKVTGSFRGKPDVSVTELAKLKGESGEQGSVRQDDLDWLVNEMRENGLANVGAPYIEVGYDGVPWVSEGNHRIMAAQKLGWESMPVEIRYFDGGEREAGEFLPSRLSPNSDIMFSRTELTNDPAAPLLNIGLRVGAGDRTQKLSPEEVRALVENTGAKITRSNVVDSTYDKDGETITESTLVVELDRELTADEMEQLAIDTQQEAIPQRVDGAGKLYGPKAAEWGNFKPRFFKHLDGEASTNGVSVKAVHYSDKKRTTLDSSKYGTGMPGAEAKRVADGGIADRIHFYVDEGNGVKPESGVGGVAHEVQLDTLYDTKTDPENLVKDNKNNPNAWEQAIVDAGYEGYYAQGAYGKHGAAVLLGERTLDTTMPMFSLTQEAAQTLAPVVEEHPDELNIVNRKARKGWAQVEEKLRNEIQDKHVTLRRIQQLAGVLAENLNLDTMGALDRLGSKLMVKHNELVKTPQAHITSILKDAGFAPEEGMDAIGSYLKMKHVAEYNAQIATINPATYEADGTRIKGFDSVHTGSGITDAEAAAEIARLETLPAVKADALKAANKVYRKMIADLQDYAVEQGLEKKDKIDTWRAMFPNYTPFNRDLDLDENLSIGSVVGTKEFSMRAGISRAAMGSGADIVNPLASTLLLGSKIVRRGENAIVARTVLEFAREFTPKFKDAAGNWKAMWQVGAIPDVRQVKNVNVYHVRKADGTFTQEFYNREDANAHADNLQKVWSAANPNANMNSSGIIAEKKFDTPQRRVVMVPTPNILARPNVFVVPVNGENQIVEFDESSEDGMNILAALKGTDNSKLSNASWLTLPRMFSQWTVAMATGFNPVFIAFNIARDVPGAAINMGSHKVPGWTAADSAALLYKVPAAVPALFRDIRAAWSAEYNNKPAPTPAAGSIGWWFEAAVAAGGVTGVRESFADLDSAETQVRRMWGASALAVPLKANEADTWLKKFNSGIAKVGDSMYRMGEGTADTNALVKFVSQQLASRIAHMNNAGEAATRTLVFKESAERFMAAGKSQEEAFKLAANVSKNISTNFNRRGSNSTLANQLFPFFNASAQGGARLAETLFEKKTIVKMEDGRAVLDQGTRLTPYGKKVLASMVTLGAVQAALLSMLGFEDDEPPKAIRDRALIMPIGGGSYIAIPLPHGFNVLFNFGREMTDAILKPEKAAEYIGQAVWQGANFSPVGAAGSVLHTMSPAILDPIIGILTNEDAFGRPIGREDLNPSSPTPGFTRAREGASSTGKAIAKGLNMITGGNEDQPGMVSPTPEMVDFVIGMGGGGLGRELSKTITIASNAVNKALGNEVEDIPFHKYPLIGRLGGNVDSAVSERSRMFKIRTELNSLNARYEGLLEREEFEKADAFSLAHPELEMRDTFERFARQDSKQRKARAVARTEDDIAVVNSITAEQEAGVKDLLQQYKEMINAEE